MRAAWPVLHTWAASILQHMYARRFSPGVVLSCAETNPQEMALQLDVGIVVDDPGRQVGRVFFQTVKLSNLYQMPDCMCQVRPVSGPAFAACQSAPRRRNNLALQQFTVLQLLCPLLCCTLQVQQRHKSPKGAPSCGMKPTSAAASGLRTRTPTPAGSPVPSASNTLFAAAAPAAARSAAGDAGQHPMTSARVMQGLLPLSSGTTQLGLGRASAPGSASNSVEASSTSAASPAPPAAASPPFRKSTASRVSFVEDSAPAHASNSRSGKSRPMRQPRHAADDASTGPACRGKANGMLGNSPHSFLGEALSQSYEGGGTTPAPQRAMGADHAQQITPWACESTCANGASCGAGQCGNGSGASGSLLMLHRPPLPLPAGLAPGLLMPVSTLAGPPALADPQAKTEAALPAANSPPGSGAAVPTSRGGLGSTRSTAPCAESLGGRLALPVAQGSPAEEAASSRGVPAGPAVACTKPTTPKVPHYMLPLRSSPRTSSAPAGCLARGDKAAGGSTPGGWQEEGAGGSVKGQGGWHDGAASVYAIATKYRLGRQQAPCPPAGAVGAGAAAASPAAAKTCLGSPDGVASMRSRPTTGAGQSAGGRAVVKGYLLEQLSAPVGHSVRRRVAAMEQVSFAGWRRYPLLAPCRCYAFHCYDDATV
jgi:hypothetical protein